MSPLTRAGATKYLASRLTNEVVVSNLGQASLDLLAIADRPLNCYTFGAMGQCSSIGLGIAIGRPDVRVICLDGDGSLLMNLGSLCTIAAEAPKNYVLMVWDNYESALPQFHDGALPVVGEKRSVQAAAGKFVDIFAPLAVHVYVQHR